MHTDSHRLTTRLLKDGWFLLGAIIILLLAGLNANNIVPQDLLQTLLRIFR